MNYYRMLFAVVFGFCLASAANAQTFNVYAFKPGITALNAATSTSNPTTVVETYSRYFKRDMYLKGGPPGRLNGLEIPAHAVVYVSEPIIVTGKVTIGEGAKIFFDPGDARHKPAQIKLENATISGGNINGDPILLIGNRENDIPTYSRTSDLAMLLIEGVTGTLENVIIAGHFRAILVEGSVAYGEVAQKNDITFNGIVAINNSHVLHVSGSTYWPTVTSRIRLVNGWFENSMDIPDLNITHARLTLEVSNVAFMSHSESFRLESFRPIVLRYEVDPVTYSPLDKEKKYTATFTDCTFKQPFWDTWFFQDVKRYGDVYGDGHILVQQSPIAGPPFELFPKYDPPITGDYNNSGKVDISDFVLFVQIFGLSTHGIKGAQMMDHDGNGQINFADFFTFAENFGKTKSANKPTVKELEDIKAQKATITEVMKLASRDQDFMSVFKELAEPAEQNHALRYVLTHISEEDVALLKRYGSEWLVQKVMERMRILERPKPELALEQNYPNPFNPETTITFSLADPGHVKVLIYSLSGQVVRTLVNDRLSPGMHKISWDGKDSQGHLVSSGVYVYTMQAGGAFTQTKKMILLK